MSGIGSAATAAGAVTLSLRSRLELVRRTIPGLVHFDADPLEVPINRPVRRIRVSLPAVGALELRGIELDTDAPPDPTRVRASLSSVAPSSGPAEEALRGRVIATLVEPFPHWEVRFRGTVPVKAIRLQNKRGSVAYGNAAIQVEYEDAKGFSWTFDNVGPSVLRARADAFLAAAEALAGGEWGRGARAPDLDRVRDLATGLHGALVSGLEGAPPDLTVTEAMRLDLVRAVNGVADALPDASLTEGLERAAAVLQSLLHRGGDRADPTGTDDEGQAVAVICAAIFLRRKSVSNRRLRENQRFTGTPARANRVDRYVSSIYVRATGDESLLPIMIRSHGLSGALLHGQSDRYVGSIQEIEGIFAELGYEFAICYGTFLGAVRDKRFIPHDDDVDTAFLVRSTNLPDALKEMEGIVQTLRARGMTINLTRNGFMKMRAPTMGKRMDIFPVIRNGEGTVHMLMEGLRFRDVPRDVVLPFGTVEFYGRTFRCPAKAEGFLEQRYGKTWITPLRQVGAKTVAANVGDEDGAGEDSAA